MRASHLISSEHLCLLQCLHGVYSPRISLLDQPHLRNVQIRRSMRERRGSRTSPNAPFPITLTVLKSPSPIFVRRKRRNWLCVLVCLRASRAALSSGSPASRRSSSWPLPHSSAHVHEKMMLSRTEHSIRWSSRAWTCKTIPASLSPQSPVRVPQRISRQVVVGSRHSPRALVARLE